MHCLGRLHGVRDTLEDKLASLEAMDLWGKYSIAQDISSWVYRSTAYKYTTIVSTSHSGCNFPVYSTLIYALHTSSDNLTRLS